MLSHILTGKTVHSCKENSLIDLFFALFFADFPEKIFSLEPKILKISALN